MRYLDALIFLHRVYRRHPPQTRAHILIRFLTCPFLRILDEIPASGTMLEIGAGHGVFSYLASHAKPLRVTGVDPDLRKVLIPHHAPGVQFVAAYDDAVRGAFDAVAILDVTYLLPIEERRALYRRIFERLKPGGVFLLKEMDPAHRWKMKWARTQERLSNRFLRITLGDGFLYQPREDVEAMLREVGFADVRSRPVGAGYPHPHLVYVARR